MSKKLITLLSTAALATAVFTTMAAADSAWYPAAPHIVYKRSHVTLAPDEPHGIEFQPSRPPALPGPFSGGGPNNINPVDALIAH